MDLWFITKLGSRFRVFGKRDWYDWTTPKEFWECREATMLEF